MNAYLAILKRDLVLANRNRSALFNPLLFFALLATLFSVATSASAELLSEVSSGIIWVGALLASLLSIDNLFRSDYEDGSLEQWLLSPNKPTIMVLMKVLSHWLVSGVPIIIVTPLLAVILHFPMDGLKVLVLSLLIGTPVLSLVGAIGLALTIGLRKSGMLLPLLVLPFYIPVLIFANNAVLISTSGGDAGAQLTMLLAMLVLALTLTPITVVSCLKLSLG